MAVSVIDTRGEFKALVPYSGDDEQLATVGSQV